MADRRRPHGARQDARDLRLRTDRPRRRRVRRRVRDADPGLGAGGLARRGGGGRTRRRRLQGRVLRGLRCALAAHAARRGHPRDRHAGRPRGDEGHGPAGQHEPGGADRTRGARRRAARRASRHGRGRCVRARAASRAGRPAADAAERRVLTAHRLRHPRGVRPAVLRHLRPDQRVRRGRADQRRQPRGSVGRSHHDVGRPAFPFRSRRGGSTTRRTR